MGNQVNYILGRSSAGSVPIALQEELLAWNIISQQKLLYDDVFKRFWYMPSVPGILSGSILDHLLTKVRPIEKSTLALYISNVYRIYL